MAALVPIILMLLLLTHSNLAGTIHSSDEHHQKVLQTTNLIERNYVVFKERVTKCDNDAENTNKEQQQQWEKDDGEEENNGEIPGNKNEVTEKAQFNIRDTDKIVSDLYNSFWGKEGTPEQIRATQAEVMLKYIDQTVKPCDDFYQYACGNWEKLNPIPKDKTYFNTLEKLSENLLPVLRELLTSTTTETETNDEKSEDGPADVSTSIIPLDLLNTLNRQVAKVRLRRRILRKQSTLNTVLRKFETQQRRIKRKVEQIIDISDAETKARNLYKSCINYELIEKRGLQPLKDLLKFLGGWPVLESNWDPHGFDWLDLTAKLRLYNNDVFIGEWVGPDMIFSNTNIIQFDETRFGLPAPKYFILQSYANDLKAYQQFMESVITLLDVDAKKASTVANEIIEFETELAKIVLVNIREMYIKLSLERLHEEVPQIDWQRYLTIVLDRPVNRSEMVVMFAMKYMKNLVALLSETEPRTIANYLFWRFVKNLINNLDDRFQGAKQKFDFALFGQEELPPRWKVCVNQVNSNMGMAVGALFVRKYFDENIKKDTLDMTHELQQSFRVLLNATAWIDEPTKQLAELKLNAMSLNIGYPDLILSKADLNEQYKHLKIDPDKYFENTLAILVHLQKSEKAKLGEKVNKTSWDTAPADVNAYYYQFINQIMFPAGILQPPFYHKDFPRSLNYGGIGVVIGHEITHGFDDMGRWFDVDGNLQKWWSDLAIDGFNERAKCLISQYGNFTVSEVGIPVDGENTLGENIADNGGIKQSFLAYKHWLHTHKDEEELMQNEVLPGINATNTQLFFLNFAQVWCGAMRPEATKKNLKTAVHSPGRFRVIGTLSNSEDFAHVYGCPVGSPMNPATKCSVW